MIRWHWTSALRPIERDPFDWPEPRLYSHIHPLRHPFHSYSSRRQFWRFTCAALSSRLLRFALFSQWRCINAGHVFVAQLAISHGPLGLSCLLRTCSWAPLIRLRGPRQRLALVSVGDRLGMPFSLESVGRYYR